MEQKEIDLGGHPAKSVFIGGAVLLGITIAIVTVAVLANRIAGAAVGFIAGLAWMFIGGPVVFGYLIASFSNASRVYTPAWRLVSEGRLIPAYMGRNVSCKGLAVVDEQNRRLYVNGQLYNFADIKSISSGWQKKKSTTDHYVEIVAKHGANPVHKVWFDSQGAAETFYHRLGNNLGFA